MYCFTKQDCQFEQRFVYDNNKYGFIIACLAPNGFLLRHMAVIAKACVEGVFARRPCVFWLYTSLKTTISSLTQL